MTIPLYPRQPAANPFKPIPPLGIVEKGPPGGKGDRGDPGPAGPPGIAGPPGPSSYDSYVALGGKLTEAEWSAPASGGPIVMTLPITAASSFTASHSFSYRPHVWLVDASGAEVETDTLYAPGQVTVVFPAPFTGTLYLG